MKVDDSKTWRGFGIKIYNCCMKSSRLLLGLSPVSQVSWGIPLARESLEPLLDPSVSPRKGTG
jgi:hypothetical protein